MNANHVPDQDWAATTKLLVDSGKLNTYDSNGETPLMKVCTNYEAAKHMIKAGANIYIGNNMWSKSALQIIGSRPVSKAVLRLYMRKVEKDCGYNNEKIAKILISEQWSLHSIVGLKDVGLTRFALEQRYKKNIDIRQTGISTALQIAISKLDIDHINLLLQYNADINARNGYARTSLSLVYENHDDNTTNLEKKLEILKILLDRKAVSKHKTIDTPHDVINFLMYAPIEAIKVLMMYGMDPSIANTDYSSVLHSLAANKNPGVIEMLYNKSFNIEARTTLRQTPLMIAAKFGNANTLKFLLNQGAQIEANASRTPLTKQNTALYFAVRNYSESKGQYKECVQILLEHGAKSQIIFQNSSGQLQTILNLIQWNEKVTVAMIILAHLALQKTNGVHIIEIIQTKIKAQNEFHEYFKSCETQLMEKAYAPFKLFNLLTNDNKIERLVCNEEVISKLNDFVSTMCDTYYYYSTLLEKRIKTARQNVTLKHQAARIICKIMQTNYERFPLIADNIISYLEIQDIKNFIDAL